MNLNKKCITLSEVNNKFTEDVLINILSKICSGKEVQLTDWSFNEGSAKGDNYLSNIYKGKINGIINGDPKQHVQANIVVKSMPKNPGTRKTLRCIDFFNNEIAFYTQVRLDIYTSFSETCTSSFEKNYIYLCNQINHSLIILQIIPKFENFLAEKGQTDLLCIPRHVISSTDNENGFLILEDASCLGFRAVSRQNCLDWAECLAVLKTLSKFHAISFAYKDQKKEEFAEMTNSLKETLFGHEHWDWYKGFHVNNRNIL